MRSFVRGSGVVLVAVVALLGARGVVAVEEYALEIPNRAAFPSGEGNGCDLCHGASSSFVNDFEAAGFTWTPGLAGQDSDGDGFSNGWELQDPSGAWMPGLAEPGDVAFVSDPSAAGDLPPLPVEVDPTSVLHVEAAGTNGTETLAVINVGGVPFDWTLTPDQAWVAPSPDGEIGLDPSMQDLVTLQFLTDGFSPGDYMANLQLAIPGIAANRLPVIPVDLTVPEPGAAALGLAALGALGALGAGRRR